MNLKQASINEVQGEGQASVCTVAGKKEVNGQFITDDPLDCIEFIDSEKILFTGVLYDGDTEIKLTFPIMITNFKKDVVIFKGIEG